MIRQYYIFLYILIGLFLSSCDTVEFNEPQLENMKLVYEQLPDNKRYQLAKTLRYAGLYEGELEASWQVGYKVSLEEAYELLSWDVDNIDPSTELGAARFLDNLASPKGRVLLGEWNTDSEKPWSLERPGNLEVIRNGNRCEIEVGFYKRFGESINLSFYVDRKLALSSRSGFGGVILEWDGLQGSGNRMFYTINTVDDSFLTNGEIQVQSPKLSRIVTFNDRWKSLLNILKLSDQMTLNAGKKAHLIDPFIFDDANIRNAAIMLEKCAINI